MHVGATQFVHGVLLACRRLHQRRTGQKNRAGTAHDDVVVRQSRHVGAAGGAVPQHHRHLLHAHLRQNALVAENPAGVVLVSEDLRLQRQESAGGVTQVHHREAVLDRDIHCAHGLLHRQWIPGAALDRGVAGVDHHFASGHDADAGDAGRAGDFAVVGLIRSQRGQFQERRAGIQQLRQTFANQQLVLLAQPINVARGPVVARLALLLAELFGQLAVVRRVGLEFRRGGIQL